MRNVQVCCSEAARQSSGQVPCRQAARQSNGLLGLALCVMFGGHAGAHEPAGACVRCGAVAGRQSGNQAK